MLQAFPRYYILDISEVVALLHSHRDEVVKLVVEIQDECAAACDDRPVAGVEAILSQDPFKRPTVKKPSPS